MLYLWVVVSIDLLGVLGLEHLSLGNIGRLLLLFIQTKEKTTEMLVWCKSIDSWITINRRIVEQTAEMFVWCKAIDS